MKEFHDDKKILYPEFILREKPKLFVNLIIKSFQLMGKNGQWTQTENYKKWIEENKYILEEIKELKK